MGAFSLVSTSQGILAVGGNDPSSYDRTNSRFNYRKKILQMKCPEDQEVSGCYWDEFSQTMKVGRYGHVVIPLPASYEVPCNN